MNAKTHQTAVVLIPPEECWEPIQAIRRQHDRRFRRWMPHITLLYPFRPRETFDQAAALLQAALRDWSPFELSLVEFGYFHHGGGRYTLWLAPEPAGMVRRLQAALQDALPDCDDAARYPEGFTPHLSVGQARGAQALVKLRDTCRANWTPLRFCVRHISLIWRGKPPDDVFRVDRDVPLGPPDA